MLGKTHVNIYKSHLDGFLLFKRVVVEAREVFRRTGGGTCVFVFYYICIFGQSNMGNLGIYANPLFIAMSQAWPRLAKTILAKLDSQ